MTSAHVVETSVNVISTVLLGTTPLPGRSHNLPNYDDDDDDDDDDVDDDDDDDVDDDYQHLFSVALQISLGHILTQVW